MAELTAGLDTESSPGRDYERCLRFRGEKLSGWGSMLFIERTDNGDADREHPRVWLRCSLGGSGHTVYHLGHIRLAVATAQSRDLEDVAVVYALTAARLLVL